MHAPPSDRPTRVLVLGSGALQIGQAGEFDYSGSQCLKALKDEGIASVVINPNIATVQTSEGLADAVYFLPVTPHFVEQVLVQERCDALMLSFGGQTALDCGLALHKSGALERLGVRVLGSPISAIEATEDRALFVRTLDAIDVRTARSRTVTSSSDALVAARAIGFPVMVRAGYSLGGKGSGVAATPEELDALAGRALQGAPQALIEECLTGWKELEYEIVRDQLGACLTICNMENVDPMGVHTGESIVVAPSQTLDDSEYQMLRDVARKVADAVGIVGECNIQFALDPKSAQYRVVEVNARLSRSSALASKATGYPLAYVAARLALGRRLDEIPNSVTRTTPAFFEPALDYIVVKVPRWDLDKFEGVERALGTEMKSVGEVMAIGRSFPEALQKALRMLAVGADGLDGERWPENELEQQLARPSAERVFAVAQAFELGWPVDRVAALTRIDRWFLAEISRAVSVGHALEKPGAGAGAFTEKETERETETLHDPRVAPTERALLLDAKRAGFSDSAIARRLGITEPDVRSRRRAFGIRPALARIDTLAAEFPTDTNYLYFTYGSETSEVERSKERPVLVLGSGCYRIGSSVEFDWCCVEAAKTARALGYPTVLLNCNPETVSTDYDLCDRLVFDELTLETVLELCDFEQPRGVIVSMGGQTPNTLAHSLDANGVPLLGTSAASIDAAEDRRKFSKLCDDLGIDQPRWTEVRDLNLVDSAVSSVGGYPVIVRPSYVLSGSAMRIAHTPEELRRYLERATQVSPAHPVVISHFETHHREVELDAVADHGEIVLQVVSEHVEDAGVHSGDATLVLPPQRLYLSTISLVKRIGAKLAKALDVTGPFNVQFLARHDHVKVIECNLRASRSFPFAAKVTRLPLAAEATRRMLGAPVQTLPRIDPLALPFAAVKAPQFSFRRLRGADPILGVEMASTGEAACFGDTVDEALVKAMLATGFKLPSKGALLSLGPTGDKYRFADEARLLEKKGLKLFATAGTADILGAEGVRCERVDKGEGPDSRMEKLLRSGAVDLVINVPIRWDSSGRPDGYAIRRLAIDLEIPLLTDLWLARRVVRALAACSLSDLKPAPWDRYRPDSAI